MYFLSVIAVHFTLVTLYSQRLDMDMSWTVITELNAPGRAPFDNVINFLLTNPHHCNYSMQHFPSTILLLDKQRNVTPPFPLVSMPKYHDSLQYDGTLYSSAVHIRILSVLYER